MSVFTEEIDWLDDKFHGLVIGANGSRKSWSIKEKTGATVEIKNKRCFITGTQVQIENAKDTILKTIQSNLLNDKESILCVVQKRGNHKPKPDGGVKKSVAQAAVNDFSWESVEFLDSKYFSEIIGKCGNHIKDLQSRFGLQMRKDEKINKIVIKGDEEAKCQVKEWLMNFVSKKEQASVRKRSMPANNVDLGWHSIDFISSQYFGSVIGKGGANIKKIEKEYDVSLRVDKDINKIVVNGSDKARYEVEQYFKSFISIKLERYVIKTGVKKIFFVGLKPDDTVVMNTVTCKDFQHCQIVKFNNTLGTEKRYINIPNFENALMDALQIAKTHIDDNPNHAVCDILLHGGKMHYQVQPGSYKVSDLQKSKSYIYERLSQELLTFEKVENLPEVRTIIRYDVQICTPEPFVKLRYKIYIATDEDGNPKFLTSEEAKLSNGSISNITSGPGYFFNKCSPIAKFDIVDPMSNITTRLNIDVFYSDAEHDSLISKHMKVLKTVFFDQIKLTKSDNEFDLYLTDLPAEYVMTFYRRSDRNDYLFASTNILRTSQEKIIYADNNCNGESVTDVFFVSEIINTLFQTTDWTVKEVSECFKTTLEFSDKMIQYLM